MENDELSLGEVTLAYGDGTYYLSGPRADASDPDGLYAQEFADTHQSPAVGASDKGRLR
jgi:hypothetical protein